MSAGGTIQAGAVQTDIPSRLDRLPWSGFHALVVTALGITWILDGLEVTIVGSLGPILQDKRTLGLSAEQIGTLASFYVVGAVSGAMVFGWLTDRLGRKRIFYFTLATYVVGVLLSACAWNFWSFAVFRFITGFGIGGEYAAINSAIDELMPARLRGRIDVMVNGSYWLGAAAGAAASIPLLSGSFVSISYGWRLGFAIGGVLGIGVIFLRHLLPESPRWQVTHGKDRGRQAHHGGHRRPGDGQRRRHAGTRHRQPDGASAQKLRLRVDLRRHARQAPRPLGAGVDADGGAGIPVQRGVLHLRPSAAALRARGRRRYRAVYPAAVRRATCSARWCWGISSTRSAARR